MVVHLYFEKPIDVINATSLLIQDSFKIVGVGVLPSSTHIRVLMPETLKEALEKGECNWKDFALTVERRYGAVNYAVERIATPAQLYPQTHVLY